MSLHSHSEMGPQQRRREIVGLLARGARRLSGRGRSPELPQSDVERRKTERTSPREARKDGGPGRDGFPVSVRPGVLPASAVAQQPVVQALV